MFWGGTAPLPPINRSAGPVGGSAPRPHSDVVGKAAFPCGPGGAAAVNIGSNSSAGGAMSQGPKMAPCGQNEFGWEETVKIGGNGETPGKDPQRKEKAGKKMKRKPNKRERREKQQKAKEDRKEAHVRKVAARLERTRELKGQGWTRGRIKSHWKKVGRTSRRKKLRRVMLSRRRWILKERLERRPLLQKKWKGQILTGGAWNTRGWGAKHARIDQYMKSECIFALMAARKSEFEILTDIRFESNGVREYDTTRGKWIVIVQGKVGVALGPGMTEK